MAANSEPNSEGDTHFKDALKPDGDAYCDDGMRMRWSGPTHHPNSSHLCYLRKGSANGMITMMMNLTWTNLQKQRSDINFKLNSTVLTDTDPWIASASLSI